MNPKDFNWSSDQQVTVVNPTKDSFNFMVHNKEYTVGTGRTAKMPGYIAWVYVHKLATKMAVDDGNFDRWNEEGYRQEYYDKLVAGTDDIIQTVEVQPKIETFDTVEDEIVDDKSGIKPMTSGRKNARSSRN